MSNIREIAELANVSTCTISRYLNNKITLSHETEARVQAAIQELGYVPSSVARSLKTNQTRNIAVILPTINNLYYPEILSGINSVLEQESYSMVIHQTDEYRGVDETCFRRVYASRADGAMVVGYQRREDQHPYLHGFVDAKIPMVMVNQSRMYPGIPIVYPDYQEAGRMAAQHLFGKGRQKLGIVSYTSQHNLPILHMESYLEQANVLFGEEIDRENVFFREGRLDFSGREASPEGGPAFIGNIVRRVKEKKLDALFIIDEMLAVYVMRELLKQGLRIPDDLAIVGFGNTFFATVATPSLSSLDLCNVEIGKQSAETLLRLLKRKKTQESITIRPRLIERESS